VLDGGLPAWKAAGGEVDTSPVSDEQLHAAAEALRNPPATTRCRGVAGLTQLWTSTNQGQKTSWAKVAHTCGDIWLFE
jgi:hypothetical protein